MTRVEKLLLLLLLVFSFAIRVYQLGSNPAGFFCDEALRGIDAYHILKRGTDSHGNKFPLFFAGFNSDAGSSYNVYMTLPFVGLFGLNEQGVRIAAVFWSIIELFLFYLLLKELLNKKLALVGTFILSLSPWHFHLSRVNLGDFYSWTIFTLLSLIFLLKGVKNKQLMSLLLSALFFGLTTYSYFPARLLTPVVFLLCLLLPLFHKLYRSILLMIVTYSIVITPFIFFHLTNPNIFQRLIDTTGIDVHNQNFARLQEKNFFPILLAKYLTHYQNNFLFTKGDTDFPGQLIRRHSIWELGLLYPYQKWLIVSGLIWVLIQILKNRKYELLFVIFLLLLFPVADSLTTDKTPYATRSYLGIIPLHLSIVFGIYAIYKILIKLKLWQRFIIRFLVQTILFLFIICSAYLLLLRHTLNPLTTSDFWGWQFGPRDIIAYFVKVESAYDELIMEFRFNAPAVFFQFYAPDSCQKCLVGNLNLYNPAKKQLFALSPEYLLLYPNLHYQTKTIIYYPNGNIAFKLIEIQQF